MGILQLPTPLAAQVGLSPATKKMVTTDNLATLTAAGYLNAVNLESFPITVTDVLEILYSYNTVTNASTFGIFTVSISNGTITLVQWANPGDVLLPVVSGDFANFNGTTGQIKDAGFSPSNAAKTKVVMANAATVADHIMVSTDTAGTAGNKTGTAINDGSLQAGRDTVAGSLVSYPATTATGTLAVTAVANSGAFSGVLSNVALGQSSTWSLPDPVNAVARVLVGATATPFVSGNLPKASGTGGLMVDSGIVAANIVQSQSSVANNNVAFTVVKTLAFSQLSTAAKVNIVAHPSGTSQFAIMDIKVFTSTGLSGGGGNRLLAVSDGTIVYNNAGITAALLGTPIFTLWGGTGNPIAIGTAQISTAGADIFFQYTGGTTDYTAGSVVVAVTLVQVTA